MRILSVTLLILVLVLAGCINSESSLIQEALGPPIIEADNNMLPTMAERITSAEPFLTRNLATKVLNGMITVHWIDGGDHFWFQKQHRDGFRFILVDSATGEEKNAFDHEALAAALSEALGQDLYPDFLPVLDFTTRENGHLHVSTYMGAFACAGRPLSCTADAVDWWDDQQIVSPAGDQAVFVKENNLWLRDLTTGEEQQLTTDGSEAFRYGNLGSFDNQQVARRRAGIARAPEGFMWSPDGRYLLSTRIDQSTIPLRLGVVVRAARF
ncbi:DPP IV N-terminal domain-containing protein [Chloroflexi bacterium TSY]|nr:DPP IV N-terminal domain-containing protein [Chloroflexi bacterium TSY]